MARRIPHLMKPYASYIICTSPRSGSTLLCRLLAATGRAGHPKSYFHEPSLSDWAAYHGVKEARGWSRRATLEAVLQVALLKGRGNSEIFGLRLQRRSAAFFMSQLAALHPEMTTDLDRIQAVFGPTLFVHLTRADKIAQAVSFVKAGQTGLWHKAPDGTEIERLSEHQDPVYDFERLKEQYETFLRFEQEWSGWFGAEGISPLRITYDELSNAPQSVLQRILEALGLENTNARDVVPDVAKLADEVNADWAARFRRDLSRTL